MLKPKSRIFLEEMPKNGNNMLRSALKAGYTEATARRHGKRILNTALRGQVEEMKNALQNKDISTGQIKKMMSDIVGISPQSMFDRLKWLALENDKDAGTALKVLAPLLVEHGVILKADDEDKRSSNVPVLNLSFGNVSIAEKTAKNIEAPNDHIIIDSQEIEDGSTKP